MSESQKKAIEIVSTFQCFLAMILVRKRSDL